jgi:hypothetical protein
MLGLLATGCASTGAPPKWLALAEQAQRDPYGAWMTIEFVKPHQDRSLSGEFLAVDADSVYVLEHLSKRLDPVVGVALPLVKKGGIAHFDPQTSKAGSWVAMGSLMTLSNGVGLVLTLPLWLVAGSSMAGSQSHTPLENYPDVSWEELRKYARFPQGPPANLHGLGLRAKSPQESGLAAWEEQEDDGSETLE